MYRFTVPKATKVYRFTVRWVYRFTVENLLIPQGFTQGGACAVMLRLAEGLWA